MNRWISGLAAVLVPLLASGADFLTPKQKAEAASVGQMIEQQCLQGTTPPATAAPSVKMMLNWSKDPQVCSCIGASVRDSMTLSVFIMKEEQAHQWLLETVATSSMKCSAPIARKKFTEQCETFFTIDATEAQKPLPDASFVKRSCDCARQVLGKLSDDELIDMSLKSYSEYKERKRAGNPTAGRPKGPIDAALDSCMAREPK